MLGIKSFQGSSLGQKVNFGEPLNIKSNFYGIKRKPMKSVEGNGVQNYHPMSIYEPVGIYRSLKPVKKSTLEKSSHRK